MYLVRTLLVFLLPITTFAFPSDLMYQNSPINSLCFATNATAPTTVWLEDCSKNDDIDIHDVQQTDYTGFKYTWKSDYGDQLPPQCSSYYKIIDFVGDSYTIYTRNNMDGALQFTGIYLVKRDKVDSVMLTPLASGEGCYAGVKPNVSQADNVLTYQTTVAPRAFLALAHQDLQKQHGYEGLDNSDSYCAATVTYTRDLTHPEAAATFVSLELNSDYVNKSLNSNPHQACFNNLITSYLKSNKKILNNAQLQEFVKTVNNTCFK